MLKARARWCVSSLKERGLEAIPGIAEDLAGAHNRSNDAYDFFSTGAGGDMAISPGSGKNSFLQGKEIARRRSFRGVTGTDDFISSATDGFAAYLRY